MRAVIQRVSSASVRVNNSTIGTIGPGILTLLGVAKDDSEVALEKLVHKIVNLRIFPDDTGKMNLSLKDTKGSHLIVSQFTLLADTKKGNRPSFTGAEQPDVALHLYQKAIKLSQSLGIPTEGGQFQAHMMVEIVNDGPVTIVIEV